jgi:hypothetical protein
MKGTSEKGTYHYNAQAFGLSAEFHRPIQHLIEVQAGVSLPTIGGHGNARVDHFRFQEFVSFGAAYSHVSGSRSPDDGAYTTLVTTAVEGLNVLDVVTADRVVARLASRHPTEHNEPHILILGSKFENLQIAGCRVDVELDHELFLRLDTFEAVLKELDNNAEFRKMAQDPYQTGQNIKLDKSARVVLCSLVKDMKTACPGVKRTGHCFHVPEFGNVFVAEVLAQHSRRTLTMLRIELGCPVSAGIAIAQGQGNGSPWPPRP